MKRLLATLLLLVLPFAANADTTIKVDAQFDPDSKSTAIKTRDLDIAVGKNFVDPSAITTFIGATVDQTSKEDIYLDVVYTSNGWKYLDTAMDADAVNLPVISEVRRVAGPGKILEQFRIQLSQAYLESHTDSGLDFHVRGKSGEAAFKVPAIFVHDFLVVLNENRPGNPARPAEQAKPHFGAQLTPLQTAFASVLKLPSTQGLLVVTVLADGMAGKAGLQQGDVVLSIGGKPVNTESDLDQALSNVSATGGITLLIWRNGADLTVQAMP